MLPVTGRPATSWVHYTTSCNTQSIAHEDGRNHSPKHVELIGIINKMLLLYLVGCLFYCISDARLNKHQICPNVFKTLRLSFLCTRNWFCNKGAFPRSTTYVNIEHVFIFGLSQESYRTDRFSPNSISKLRITFQSYPFSDSPTFLNFNIGVSLHPFRRH